MITRGALACLLLVGLGSCDGKPTAGGFVDDETQPSPNASILPAPIASVEPSPRFQDGGRGGIPADSAGRLLLPEAAPPAPTPLVSDAALPGDPITSRDGPAVTLEARFRWFELPTHPKTAGAEVSSEGLARARQLTELRLTVDLSPLGRMRVVFASPSFPVPQNAELRASLQHYGHVLVWPDGHAYRVLVPGTIRALLAERRADALTLTSGSLSKAGGGFLLGLPTQKTVVKSEAGRLTLEQADVTGLSGSGALLCRLLLELIAVEPTSVACSAGTPLRADLQSERGGRLAFEVTSITRRQDLPHGLLLVPPAGTIVKLGELPPQAAGVLLSRAEAAALRSKASPGEVRPDAPGEGLLAVNQTDKLRYILLDGVPVAWVRPHAEQYVLGPLPGRYTVSWRDFFGAEVGAPVTAQLPLRSVVGAPRDAGP